MCDKQDGHMKDMIYHMKKDLTFKQQLIKSITLNREVKTCGQCFNFKSPYGLAVVGISMASHHNLFCKQRRHSVPQFLHVLKTQTKTSSHRDHTVTNDRNGFWCSFLGSLLMQRRVLEINPVCAFKKQKNCICIVRFLPIMIKICHLVMYVYTSVKT